MLGMTVKSVIYSEDRLVIILIDDSKKEHCLNVWAGYMNGDKRSEVVLDGDLYWVSKTVHCGD